MPSTRLSPAQCEEFFSRLKRANAAPETELEYTSPFELLVAVVLSAQATDVSVNRATRKLFLVANTPESILALGEDGLVDYIKSIGLFRTKAKNVVALSARLLRDHGGQVPGIRASLEMLPGVGRKTANVVLNTIFGEAAIAVDTHIFRVANRTGLAPGKNVLEVEQSLNRHVPVQYQRDAHHWLILLGRYICQARRPQCGHCTVASVCLYQPKNGGLID